MLEPRNVLRGLVPKIKKKVQILSYLTYSEWGKDYLINGYVDIPLEFPQETHPWGREGAEAMQQDRRGRGEWLAAGR